VFGCFKVVMRLLKKNTRAKHGRCLLHVSILPPQDYTGTSPVVLL